MTIKDRKIREIQLENEKKDFEEAKSKIDNKISGYCIIWNDKNQRGQYFTNRTNFESLKRVTNLIVFSRDAYKVIGSVELNKDEKGLLVEAELKISNSKELELAKTISDFIKNNLIQFKANPDIELIKEFYGDIVDENGHIKYWPITDIILTLIPAKPKF